MNKNPIGIVKYIIQPPRKAIREQAHTTNKLFFPLFDFLSYFLLLGERTVEL